MKIIRNIVAALFLLSMIGYGVLRFYDGFYSDKTAPVITLDEDAMELSVEDPEEMLMEGVTARDDQDGDLTDKVLIESIGSFLSDGSREVTYVVSDDAHNVGRAVRTLTYSDYRSPRFSCKEALRFPVGEQVDVLDYLTASDVLDGDLSSRIRLTYGQQSDLGMTEGRYELGYQVSNSAGDVSRVDLMVEIYDTKDEAYTPVIHLNRYICYVKKGKKFDPYQYIKEVSIGSRSYEPVKSATASPVEEGTKITGLFGELSNRESDREALDILYCQDIYVDNQVDTAKTGSDIITYKITTQDGYTGTARLAVVVYE